MVGLVLDGEVLVGEVVPGLVEGEENDEGDEQKDPQIPLPHPRNRKSGDDDGGGDTDAQSDLVKGEEKRKKKKNHMKSPIYLVCLNVPTNRERILAK